MGKTNIFDCWCILAAVGTLGFIDCSAQKQPDVFGETRRRISVLLGASSSGVDWFCEPLGGFWQWVKVIIGIYVSFGPVVFSRSPYPKIVEVFGTRIFGVDIFVTHLW